MVRETRRTSRKRESGQATSEYVLLIALIVIPIAAVFREFREVFRDLLDTLNRLVIGPGV